jgi:hypothetical protein
MVTGMMRSEEGHDGALRGVAIQWILGLGRIDRGSLGRGDRLLRRAAHETKRYQSQDQIPCQAGARKNFPYRSSPDAAVKS